MGVINGQEIGRRRVTTAHASASTGAAFLPITDSRSAAGGLMNFGLWGTFVGTVVVEKTFNNTDWITATDLEGVAVSLTAPGSRQIRELEQGVQYRTRCSAYTSGTATARLSQ